LLHASGPFDSFIYKFATSFKYRSPRISTRCIRSFVGDSRIANIFLYKKSTENAAFDMLLPTSWPHPSAPCARHVAVKLNPFEAWHPHRPFQNSAIKMAFAPESGPIKRMPLTALCSCPPRERTDFQIPNLRLPPTLFQNISNLYPPPFASFPHLSSPVILASERRTTGSLSRRQVRRLHQAASSGGEVSSIHSTISWDRICFELRRCHLPVR
jgi:hypothetical protein